MPNRRDASDPAANAEDTAAEAMLDAMDDAFFTRLEKDGKQKLSHEAREILKGELRGYCEIAMAMKPTYSHRVAQEQERLSKEVEKVAIKIHHYVQGKLLGISPFAELPLCLIEFAKTLHSGDGPQRGNRRRTEDDILINLLADYFYRVGGRIAVSEGGPFAKFLQAVWQVLPRDRRAATADTFARRAKSMVRQLKERTATSSRSLAIKDSSGKPQ